MIRYLLLLILFLPFFSLSQSVLPLRADTIRMEKIGGSAELHLRNATRDSLGVLTNIGNGRTRFIRARRVGDTLFIGKDTILITNDPTIQEVINNGNTISEADSIKIADGNTFTLFAGVGSTLQTKAVNTTSQTEDRFTPDLIVTRMRNLSTGNYKGYSMSSATPGISIFDQQTTSGMGYEADYRANGIANFGNRWIPDWGTVKDTIAAASGALTVPQHRVVFGSATNTATNDSTLQWHNTDKELQIMARNEHSNGAVLDLYLNSASPDSADRIFEIHGYANNAAGTKVQQAAIYAEVSKTTAGQEAARLLANITSNGLITEGFRLDGNAPGGKETFFNYSDQDWDFRIATSSFHNAFFLNGADGNLALGNANPVMQFNVERSNNSQIGAAIINPHTGTSAYSSLDITDNSAVSYQYGLRLLKLGANFSNNGAYKQDAAVVMAADNVTGGLNLAAANASGIISFYAGGRDADDGWGSLGSNGKWQFGSISATPAVGAYFNYTDAIRLASGTTAQRPTGAAAYLRYNSDSNKVEFHNGTTWSTLGGGTGTSGISGSGTTNRVAKFTSSTAIGDGLATDDGTTFKINGGSNSSWMDAPFRVYSTSTKGVYIGYNGGVSPNYGYIGAVTEGSSHDRLVLNPDGGNVGIGIANPVHTLSVSGTANISSNVTLPSLPAGTGAWEWAVRNTDNNIATIAKNAVVVDSMTIGNATFSRRGFSSSPSIATANYFTFQPAAGYLINESVNTNPPIFQMNGLSGNTLTYAGIFMTVNQRAPNGERQHMLIATSGNSQSTNFTAGNIILRPGSRASVGFPELQDTDDSVIVDLSGAGRFIVTGNDAKYAGNYAGGYTARSLTDKNYVDSSVAISNGASYTPTITSVSNVSGTTLKGARYYRHGSFVEVRVFVSVDPTSVGTTEIAVSLPIASELATDDLFGSGNCGIAAQSGLVTTDATNNRATFIFSSTDTGAQDHVLIFSYPIILP